MKLLTTMTAVCTTLLITFSTTSANASSLDSYVEKSLVEVCKSAMSKSLNKYNRTLKAYHYNDKMIAKGVICNGDDISNFARKHGSYKIAARLEKSLGNKTTITDIAAVSKINVSFDE